MGLASGARLGPYEILGPLGSGGMGEVHLAFDTRLNRKVALKYLSDPSLDLPRSRDRLLREARAAAQITHPGIAAIYDILDTAAHPCIVMEYAEGETLARIAERGPMPVGQAVSIGVQLADALAHAHTAGVIHRDLKPANVVLTQGGTAKILDFGLARVEAVQQDDAAADAVTHEAIRSQPGPLAGTPAYMAPEQLAGRPATALTDIYSLGVTLYELLTGRRPFSAKTTTELVYEVMSAPTPQVSATIASVPPLLDEIVAKAMAKESGARYQSAAEVADHLRRVARAMADQTMREPPATGVVPRPVPRWPRAAVVAAIAALAVVAFALWLRRAPAPAAGSQFVAVLPFTTNGDASAASDAAALSESLAAALEGLSSVAVLSRADGAEYLRSGADVGKSAAPLGVTMVVTGRAMSDAANRRFEVDVRRPDGKGVLARSYLLASTSLLPGVQRQVAADVVSALGVALTPADRERLRAVPACRPDAYRDYVAGRALLAREDIAGNASRAEEAFGRAAAKDAKCAPAFAGLAEARWARFRETKDPALVEAASQAIETACALDPVSPAINASLAEVYRGKGKADQAEKVIRGVIERRPYDDEPHRLLSEILDDQGRSEEATAELQRAIGLRPNNVINRIALGNDLYKKGRYADAATVYQRVLQIQPDNVWGIGNLGAAYWMMGDLEKALAVYERAPQQDAAFVGNAGSLYLLTGRYRQAIDTMRKAVSLAPQDDILHRNLGDAYLRVGSRREALDEYRQAVDLTREQLKVNAKDAAVLARHALYEAKLGRRTDALAHASQAAALRPDDNSVLYKRAAVHALLGQKKAAAEWLGQALEKGYSTQDARADVDLDSIRAMPEVVRRLGPPDARR